MQKKQVFVTPMKFYLMITSSVGTFVAILWTFIKGKLHQERTQTSGSLPNKSVKTKD